MSKAIEDVIAERRRQIQEEDWSATHDDHHETGELAQAGAVYALYTAITLHPYTNPDEASRIPKAFWTWHARWWKPTDSRRNLVKAAALIVAEIDRLDRVKP